MKRIISFGLLTILLFPCLSLAMETQQELIQKVGIDQKLGSKIPFNLLFVNEKGQEVQLGQLFRGKPVVLLPVYYECPMLCTLVLNGFVKALLKLKFTIGKEFDVITFSIDPGEGTDLARGKKKSYLRQYRRESAEEGWHFLTGNQASIEALTQAIGFRYVYDPKIDEYAHVASLQVLTADGRIANYFSEIEFKTRDLRLALVEASQRKIASFTDIVLLMCYHYDPAQGKYGFVIYNIMRFFWGLTVGLLGAFIFISLKNDPNRSVKGLKQNLN